MSVIRSAVPPGHGNRGDPRIDRQYTPAMRDERNVTPVSILRPPLGGMRPGEKNIQPTGGIKVLQRLRSRPSMSGMPH